jgi:hypothetical protein
MENRPFTRLEHIPVEHQAICAMADSLCLLLDSSPGVLQQPRPITVYRQEAMGRGQRMILNRPNRLVIGLPLTVVGFFGQKLDEEALLPRRNKFDQALIAEFPNHPELLSYSTLELPDGNFGNLVLFSRPEAKDHWNTDPTHARAVRELAPTYYASVRLYNGVLPRGLAASHALRLTRVKYYDYTARPVWRAQRVISPGDYGQ